MASNTRRLVIDLYEDNEGEVVFDVSLDVPKGFPPEAAREIVSAILTLVLSEMDPEKVVEKYRGDGSAIQFEVVTKPNE